jgi:butyryl-CoA dehydrogenase
MVKRNSFTESSEEIIKLIEKIAIEQFAPRAAEYDKKHTFPRNNIDTLGEAGFMGLIVSEASGGTGGNRNLFSRVVKEIAGACASTSLVYVSHLIAAKAIEMSGTKEAEKKFLKKMVTGHSLGAFAVHESGSGSNVGAITTKAVNDGNNYIVNGSKFLITSAGEADVYLVLLKTDSEGGSQEMSALLIEKDAPGLSFGRLEEKMGLTATSSREIYFDECRVPTHNLLGDEGEGAQIIGKTVVGWGFFGAAAISAGIAKSATELGTKHARERTILGQPIAINQAVQFMITDMVLGCDAVEAMLDFSSTTADSFPDRAILKGFKAKLFASEAAVDVANRAIQVLGGHGYCSEYTVERLLRDARGLTLHFKTSEWLRQDIAKAVLEL